MRILSIIPYSILPAQSGGQVCILGLQTELGRQHQVWAITPKSMPQASGLSFAVLPCLSDTSIFRYSNIFKLLPIWRWARSKQIELCWIEQPYLFWIGWALRLLLGIPFYIRSHNIEADRFRSIGKWWWRGMYYFERFAYRRADSVVFITQEDAQRARQLYDLVPAQCQVAYFGVSAVTSLLPAKIHQELKDLGIPSELPYLLFFGNLAYAPNVEAISIIVQELIPRWQPYLHAHPIYIVGKGLSHEWQTSLAAVGIRYLGFVPSLSALIQGAGLVLNPVQSGGGVKTKVIEAIANQTPVISTATGAAGIDIAVCGKQLHIVPDNDWNAFSNACLTYLQAPKPTTPDAFYEEYVWEAIINRITWKN